MCWFLCKYWLSIRDRFLVRDRSMYLIYPLRAGTPSGWKLCKLCRCCNNLLEFTCVSVQFCLEGALSFVSSTYLVLQSFCLSSTLFHEVYWGRIFLKTSNLELNVSNGFSFSFHTRQKEVFLIMSEPETYIWV